MEYIADNLWPFFLAEAREYQSSNEIYFSPTEMARYKIIDVSNKVITIKRLNGNKTKEKIGKKKFETIIRRINQFGNSIPKGQIYDHVAEETTVVELLPFLDWSDNGKHIIILEEMDTFPDSVTHSEAEDDDIDLKVERLIRLRKGQNKFRIKLFDVYNNTCAITGCNIIETLHACHINPHSNSGNNKSTNGLLLRSDIHDLFDSNLIAINPKNFEIRVSSKLMSSEYIQYHQRYLAQRKDDIHPDINSLQARFEKLIV